MSRINVIINEEHSLMEEQQQLIQALGEIHRVNIPAQGCSLKDLKEIAAQLIQEGNPVVVVSPIPVLLGLLSASNVPTIVTHNDHRQKKELPNGKILSVVAETGWELVRVN